MRNEILELWEKLNSKFGTKKILLVNHIRMDPDAFWSLWAFYLILKKNWYNVKATNDEVLPENFKFLVDFDFIEPELDIKKYDPDIIISFDAASLWQLWETYKNFKEIFDNKFFVVIDHHITNKSFWNLNIINHKSSSTCELVYEIIETLDFLNYIDKQIASLLITWILTDTNMYYNSNTTSKTLQIASNLLDLWANFRKSMFNFFKKKTFNKTRLWWEVLKDLKISNDWKIVWWIITKDIFEKTNSNYKDVSGLINEFLSNMEWNIVSFLLYELKDWWVKASFRSTEINVWDFCGSFPWWWWHKQAAWFTIFEDIKVIEKEVLERLWERLNVSCIKSMVTV